jgi:hypothetical protein
MLKPDVTVHVRNIMDEKCWSLSVRESVEPANAACHARLVGMKRAVVEDPDSTDVSIHAKRARSVSLVSKR